MRAKKARLHKGPARAGARSVDSCVDSWGATSLQLLPIIEAKAGAEAPPKGPIHRGSVGSGLESVGGGCGSAGGSIPCTATNSVSFARSGRLRALPSSSLPLASAPAARASSFFSLRRLRAPRATRAQLRGTQSLSALSASLRTRETPGSAACSGRDGDTQHEPDAWGTEPARENGEVNGAVA